MKAWLRRLPFVIAMTNGLLVAAPPVRADDAPSTRNVTISQPTSIERAREYFVRGGEAASRKAWEDAIHLYLESYLQLPHPSTLHNIGYCYFEAGEVYDAFFFTVRALFERPPDGVGPLSEANRRAGEAQLAVLRERLGTVALESGEDQFGGWIRVDGTLVTKVFLGEGRFGLLPVSRGKREPVIWSERDVLLLEAGTHQIRIGDGVRQHTMRVEVTAGQHSSVKLDGFDSPVTARGAERPPADSVSATNTGVATASRPQGGKSSITPSVPAAPSTQPLEEIGSMWRNLAYGAWITSGIAVGLGVGASIVASDLDRELDVACPNESCPQSYAARVQRYDTAAMASYVGFGLGVATAAAGVVFWFQGKDAPELALTIQPHVLALRGAF